MRKLSFIVILVTFSAVNIYSAKTEIMNKSKKVLITGFAPFGGEKVNPSYEAVDALPEKISGNDIIKKELPVTFSGSVKTLYKFIEEFNPDIIICVGQAGGRSNISMERVAINIDDARIPDNNGDQPIDKKIFKNGKNAYFSTLPIKAIVKNIKDEGIPAGVSNTAGTYVCNHIMYALLYGLDKNYPGKLGGFIHVPYAPNQVVNKKNMPSMSVRDISRALKIAIKIALNTEKDIVETGGRED